MPRPMPEAAPVTTTTLPLRETRRAACCSIFAFTLLDSYAHRVPICCIVASD